MAQKTFLSASFCLIALFLAGEVESHQKKMAAYPQVAIDQCLEGYVLLKYKVDDRGRPSNLEVVESSPEGVFEESVIYAVGYWWYGPKHFGKEFIRTLEFSIHDGCTPIDKDPNQ
jgi:TonB family protein